ncbi:uncharacterized protein LOC113649457 [Tachysurus fulvidraco]|uniref:uncharacterized protein LOC113649457 n=1 Tax=Tachysurus fulvidraco TaxID=1234273 RepID=UPI001FED97BE|nr:uncharacterized protein LOC113649457 [Tachysurus fulvidraco]XP_027013076.2 uncharacterized protein LOC113649457 [Tachysurus fulvidraco]
MYEIHTEFNICDKIVRTTTDNGSNFLKAFRIYGELEENNNPETVEGARQSQVGKRESGDDDDDDDYEEEENNEGVEFVETGTMLDQDDGPEYQLPKHHHCACHLLNLVSTVDVLEANFNSAYKRLSRSAFAKCSSLWHKSARSNTADEIIKVNCKLQLLRPNDTRWNSLFLAVERIVRIVREQGERAITAVCSALKIPMFCAPLVDALLAGIEKRFGQMLVDPELIAAAILLSKFKTCWTSDECVLKLGLDYIKSHLKQQMAVHQGETTHSSEDDDFFSAMKKKFHSRDDTSQLETYLNCPSDTLEILKSFSALCHLSLRLNTPLPASAACERMFSTAGLIFTPKRACMDSKNFENQLLLKLNKDFC